MGVTKLNGRLKRLESAYGDLLLTPEEREVSLWKQRTVFICYRPGESREDALERSGINPQQWGEVKFKCWPWEWDRWSPMPEHPLWMHGHSREEGKRYEEMLLQVHAQRDAQRQAQRQAHHGQAGG